MVPFFYTTYVYIYIPLALGQKSFLFNAFKEHTYQLRGMASTLRMRTIIIREVVAMDSCFALVGAHQHGIVVGLMSRINPRIRDPLLPTRVQALL